MNWLDGTSSTSLMRAVTEWKFWSRRDQFWPEHDDWTTWLLLGGRGAGKTRAGAEWITSQVLDGVRRVALVGETYEDVREVMIEGPSGLVAVSKPGAVPAYEPSRHRVTWPGGAEAHVFSAGDPDGLRGYQFEAAWSDELTKWPRLEHSWTNLQLCLRLGDRPRQVVTTTPRPLPFLKELMAEPDTVTTCATTFDNRPALANAFLTHIVKSYDGTRIGRQELLGEIVEDTQGALWSRAMIEQCRASKTPPLDRIVVAVDPPVTSGAGADECGIIVAGRTSGATAEAVAHILHDGSVGGMSPAGWAAEVVALARRFSADRVVAEINQGGELVETVLRLAEPALPYRAVRATRGKAIRAEPVAALYEKGRVRHVGAFPELEDQLASFKGSGSAGSPDRLDALVWAVTDLLISPTTSNPNIHIL